MDINTLYNKIEPMLSFLKNNNDDKNVIDLLKTFSSANIDIIPIIKKILQLPDTFPNNILHTREGGKYNELEFFQSNQDSSSTNNTRTNSNALFEKS